MKKPYAALAAVGISAALALTGCAGGTESAPSTEPSAASSTAVQANSADETFASGMAVHHQQAIEMSDILLAKENVDAETRQLAEEIKAAQAPEIEKLEQWQHDWGMDMDHGTGMMDHGDGMMSAEDLQALRDAEGPAATKLFLEQMIEHHEGAVRMAQTQVEEGAYDPAVQMAEHMIQVQQGEIDHMRQLLEGK